MVIRPAKKFSPCLSLPCINTHVHKGAVVSLQCSEAGCDSAAANTAACTSHFCDIKSNRHINAHTWNKVNGNAPPVILWASAVCTSPFTIHTFLSFYCFLVNLVYFCLTRIRIMFQCLCTSLRLQRSRRTKSPLIVAEEPLC